MTPNAILLIGKLLFAAVGVLAGIALARTARRTGGFPPEAWASAMVFIGGGGLITFAVGDAVGAEHSALARAAIIGGDFMERLALALLWIFVGFVFHREDRWARIAVSAGIAALAASFAFELASGNLPYHDGRSLPYQLSQLVFALPFSWSAVETHRHHLRMRKQVALGLAEPMVCNRFLLWSLATAGFAGICLTAVAASLAEAGDHAILQGVIVLARAALFLLVSAIVGVGFRPPTAYRRRVEAGVRSGVDTVGSSQRPTRA